MSNLKKLSNQHNYLLSKGIVTIDDLDTYLSSVEHKQHSMNDGMRKNATRIKELNVRIERKKTVLETYHKALQPKKSDAEKRKEVKIPFLKRKAAKWSYNRYIFL